MTDGKLSDIESLKRPIQLLANDCESYFQNCMNSAHRFLADVDEVASRVREYHEGFNAWASFLSVFEKNELCLDNRLRKHRALQDIIIRLLETLRRNTYYCVLSLYSRYV